LILTYIHGSTVFPTNSTIAINTNIRLHFTYPLVLTSFAISPSPSERVQPLFPQSSSYHTVSSTGLHTAQLQRGISSPPSPALTTNPPTPWPIFSKASSEALLPSRLLFPAMLVRLASQPIDLPHRWSLTARYRLRRLRDSSLAVSTFACRLFCFLWCGRCHQHCRCFH
jgi:hypothetical protein